MKINKIEISEFKALRNVILEPGNVNVLIGANGTGKSTFLEAVGLLSLAMTDRLDDLALSRKGIRLSTPSLYKTNLEKFKVNPQIGLALEWDDDASYRYDVHFNPPIDKSYWRYGAEVLTRDGAHVWGRSNRSAEITDDSVGLLMLDLDEDLVNVRTQVSCLKKYAIYQPVTPILRGTLPDPIQIAPIGLSGGRLAEAIADLIREENGEILFGDMDMDELLEMIDWADSISITSPNKSNINANVPATRRVIEFRDRYMKQSKRFTAYDASEGALYVLFLMCLALHPDTPDIFAIDNFDQAMNPRLAKEITGRFCNEIIKRGKTVFLTTHNPLVLDGLDLTDERIRLFETDRDENGHIIMNRIRVSEELISTGQSLSRLWINGYLGGVPELI